ncbi:hypothetical protein E2C01_032127 [Portunus trituberculatus]|uniref:FHA domain-containing protein n=1 Tax=Portunus trituberculatus TaxID=210409 RepID=A0A5B7EZS2_PORTR|nr:hypothetical protein [Portunus trituberculatus]
MSDSSPQSLATDACVCRTASKQRSYIPTKMWCQSMAPQSRLRYNLPSKPHLASDAAGVARRHVVLRLDVQGFRIDLRGRWVLHGKEGLDGLDFTLIRGVS